MPSTFVYHKTVEFSETDMAGIVHFSNYFRYMEIAEHAFYRSLGFSVHAGGAKPESGSWPRVHASCDFRGPLRFEEVVVISLEIIEIKQKTLRYRMTLSEKESGRLAAVGELVVVYVKFLDDGTMKAAPIPKEISDKIELSQGRKVEPSH